MRHYLHHLLRDIAAARRTAPPPSAEPESQFAEVERYLHEEPELALGQHSSAG